MIQINFFVKSNTKIQCRPKTGLKQKPKVLETKLLKNEKHQTRVSLLLEIVSDAYLTANRTRYMWSSTQETTPLDHASPTTSRSQAAGNDSRLCRVRNTQNPLCGKTKAAPHNRDLPDKR